jgi:long-chain acyl-CoA synthetase
MQGSGSATAALTAPEHTSGAATMADLLPLAAERFAEHPAVRFKRGDAWQELSFAEVGEIVREIALGLIDLGVAAGEHVCILANTRPEWTFAEFGIVSAGAVAVPIYPTNSAKECEWVAGNSEAAVVVCEDHAQAEKIRAVRAKLPALRQIVVIDSEAAAEDTITLDALRERGRGGDRAEWVARYTAVKPEDPFTFIYTSGTTGPPKGCVLTHANYRAVLNGCHAKDIIQPGEIAYLYLPLAHAFALLVQLLCIDGRGTIAYWTGQTSKIVPELQELHPTWFPSVPRIFEKIYTLASSAIPDDRRAEAQEAIKVGLKVRGLQARGEEVPAELQHAFEQVDEKLFAPIRALFGGKVRQAVTGAAPIAREILEFFYAAGIPVLEGYGMTESATAISYSTLDSFRFGTVGRALPGVEIKIAADGEILARGGNIFAGYYRNDEATADTVIDGWLHTGDLGSLDEDGFLSITGRKKDIIITAGGKNLTPANLENDMKQSRWVSQAVMHGDRRPFPVMLITLDAEEIVPWAREHGLPEDIPSLATAPEVRALIQQHLDEANAHYAQVEQVKKFSILDHDLTQETGELTPTMKVKRNVVNEKYAGRFDELYS